MQAKNQFSRRQIRIKIFQILYSIGNESNVTNSSSKSTFIQKTNETETSFAALVLFIVKVFDYTIIHANRKASKFIRTEEDQVDISLTEIDFLEKVKSNESLIQSIKDNKLQYIYPDDLVKKTFLKLKDTKEYSNFHLNKNDAVSIENLILRTAEYAIDNEELGSEFFSERFISWEDDIEVIQRWLQLLIKQPAKIVFQNTLTDEKVDFAEELLATYLDKLDYLNDLIKPKLKNWEADRVAVIDLILIRLGLAEMLFLSDIPIKVSINEYIDIAKMYSTDQSGQFVNGVLDNLKRDLDKEGLIRKQN